MKDFFGSRKATDLSLGVLSTKISAFVLEGILISVVPSQAVDLDGCYNVAPCGSLCFVLQDSIKEVKYNYSIVKLLLGGGGTQHLERVSKAQQAESTVD